MSRLEDEILSEFGKSLPGEKFLGGFVLVALVYERTPDGMRPSTAYRAMNGQPWYLTSALLEQGNDRLDDGFCMHRQPCTCVGDPQQDTETD